MKPLGYYLGQTLHLVKLRLIAEFKEKQVELSFENFMLLHFISEHEDLTQQDLANHFQRDKSIVLRHINTLIEKRYVVRLQDQNDKRKKLLILTKKGYDAMSYSKKIAQEVSDELLKGITEEEYAHFKNVIEKIKANTGLEDTSCTFGKGNYND